MVPHILSPAPPDLKRIAKPLGRKETDPDAFAFKYGVSGNRCPMNEMAASRKQRAHIDTKLACGESQCVEHTLGLIDGSRR